jgi:hypothetical protein
MRQSTRIIEAAVAFVSVLNGANASEAEIIKCQYTDPFLTTVYSTNTSTLTFADAGDASRNKMLKNISFQIIRPNLFELWNLNQEVIQRMELNGRGRYGMGDTVYAYDATLYDYVANFNLRGGCTSNHLPATPSQ